MRIVCMEKNKNGKPEKPETGRHYKGNQNSILRAL
jgi:hypothetical protein